MATRERTMEVGQIVKGWAEKACTRANGNWELAGKKFVQIADTEYPKLNNAVATEMDRIVWKAFGDQHISQIFAKKRMAARVPADRPSRTTTKPNKSRRTAEAMDGNAEVYEEIAFLDAFSCSISKTTLRDSTFDELCREADKRQTTSDTLGRDARALFAIRDEMIKKGAKDDTLVGSMIKDAFAEKVRVQHYGNALT